MLSTPSNPKTFNIIHHGTIWQGCCSGIHTVEMWPSHWPTLFQQCAWNYWNATFLMVWRNCEIGKTQQPCLSFDALDQSNIDWLSYRPWLCDVTHNHHIPCLFMEVLAYSYTECTQSHKQFSSVKVSNYIQTFLIQTFLHQANCFPASGGSCDFSLRPINIQLY